MFIRAEFPFIASTAVQYALPRDVLVNDGYKPAERLIQGFVVNEGTLPASVQFVTSIGGGTGATAVANLTSGAVSSVTITAGGTGYSSPPTVSFSGGSGTGAAATAAVNDYGLLEIIVINGGSGYTSAPTVTLTGGTYANAGSAITVNPGCQVPVSFVIPGAADRWNIQTSVPFPAISFVGGGGSGAAAVVKQISNGSIVEVALTAGGTGYTTAPSVVFQYSGTGQGAAATATEASGAVTAITLTNGGTGYLTGTNTTNATIPVNYTNLKFTQLTSQPWN